MEDNREIQERSEKRSESYIEDDMKRISADEMFAKCDGKWKEEKMQTSNYIPSGRPYRSNLGFCTTKDSVSISSARALIKAIAQSQTRKIELGT